MTERGDVPTVGRRADGTDRPTPVTAADRPGSGRRRLGGNAAWTILDQALSSLTNVALSIVVARTVSAAEFGGFSIALVAFSLTIGVSRAVAAEPFVIRFSGVRGRQRQRAVSDACGATVAVGLLGSVGCLIAALLLPGPAGAALYALSLTLPAILLQDTLRFVFFADDQPRQATVLDLTWAISQFALIAGLVLIDAANVFLLVLAWGGSALVSAVLGAVRAGAVPRPGRLIAWWRENHHLASRLTTEYLVTMGSVYLAFLVIGSVVGLVALGALRATQVLLGPLQLMASSLTAFALPLYSRMWRQKRPLARPVLAAGAGGGLLALCWATVLLVLPTSVGVMLLGPTWPATREVLAPMSAVYVLSSAVLGAQLGLKAMNRPGAVLRAAFVQAPLMFALGTVGALVSGAWGAAVGLALGQAIGFVVTWLLLRLALRESTGTSGGPRHRAAGTPVRPTPRPKR